MATRDGSAEWKGDLKEGSGTVSVASGLFEGQYSFSSRFEEGTGTNPEELIAAAHAGCFSMALSNILAQAGHTADSVSTTAKVHLRNVDGAPTIAQIDLVTEGRVPGIDEGQFAEYAGQAKKDCPVSRGLASDGEINLYGDRARAPGSPASTARSIEASLRRLRTDFVDVYWYHQPDGITPIAETLEALDGLVKAGTARAIGASNFSAAQIEEADETARERG